MKCVAERGHFFSDSQRGQFISAGAQARREWIVRERKLFRGGMDVGRMPESGERHAVHG